MELLTQHLLNAYILPGLFASNQRPSLTPNMHFLLLFIATNARIVNPFVHPWQIIVRCYFFLENHLLPTHRTRLLLWRGLSLQGK